MRTFILTVCGCLLFAAAAAQESAPTTRKWFLGRGQRVSEVTPAVVATHSEQAPAAEPKTPTAASQPTAAPKVQGAHLHMTDPTCNFGDVPRKGGDLVHEVQFTNDGTVPLVVTRAITSCSCLKAAFPKRPVAPGDSGIIRITYEPHKSEPGAFNKVIQVYSNSTDGRDVITVQGNSIDWDSEVKVKIDRTKIKVK